MDRRLFLWGLSNGATMLALAGAFWFGLAIGLTAERVRLPWQVPAIGTLIQLAAAAVLIRAAMHLRRRSGFQRSELKHLQGVALAQKPRIVAGMRAIVCAQALLGSVAVWICVRAGAEALIWPSIGMIASLHFAPLGRLFHVPAYYVTAVAGAIVSALGFAIVQRPAGAATFGIVMAAVMWSSAGYVLRNADAIADRGCAGSWA